MLESYHHPNHGEKQPPPQTASAHDVGWRLHPGTEHWPFSFPPLWYWLGEIMPLSFPSGPPLRGQPREFRATFYLRLGEKSHFYHWLTPVNLQQELEGNYREAFMIQDSPFGRSLLPGININEAIIRHFSLILEMFAKLPLKQELPTQVPRPSVQSCSR